MPEAVRRVFLDSGLSLLSQVSGTVCALMPGAKLVHLKALAVIAEGMTIAPAEDVRGGFQPTLHRAMKDLMFTVAALYQFTSFESPAALREPLLSVCTANGVKGTILLAPEGINGTIAGTCAGIDEVLAHVRALPGCADLDVKRSAAAKPPFRSIRLRLKREIVTMGQPQVRPAEGTGHYVHATDWNALISAPDVALIDTRNDYEVAIGSFAGAINPGTRSFGEFPKWWAENRDRLAGKRIAMFCTGGIRCEKSTNFLLNHGAADVYHLKGGILKYLEEVPEKRSLWQGACFVFDNRVSVGHGLLEGEHVLCHACRCPLTPAETRAPEYEPGVACRHCVHQTTVSDKARYRERQRQIELGRARGASHLGTAPEAVRG